MKKIRKKIETTDYLWIILGTGLMALSVNLFFTPSGMVPGGMTGLAMVIEHVTKSIVDGGIPVWLGNLLLNIPLILLSIRIRGWRFLRRTILATLLFSGWLYLIPEYPFAGDDAFLNAVIGGAIMGVGLGMVFFGKATTGGTDTIAAIVQYALPHLSAAKILPVIDGLIIVLAAFIFGTRISMYATIAVVLSGRIADGLIGVFRNSYLTYIISTKHQDIAKRVMQELDRGATLLSATGVYTTNNRPVLFCAVSRKEAVLLKDIVYEVDPGAFLVLTDANEIRGEGFLNYSKEEF